MDRPGFWARTDNLVLIQPTSRRLLWVPRDLWCDCLGTRIASAFAMGGHAALREALAEHGLAPEHGLCLARPFVERFLLTVDVTVPVETPLAFRYPLAPTLPIEEGHKIVHFEPPAEHLRGERVHQWLGARQAVRGPGGDLQRIRRQQTFVRRLLEQTVAWPRPGHPGVDYRASGPGALAELGDIEADWLMETFDDVEPDERQGMSVLRSRRPRVGSGRLSQATTIVVAARRVPRWALGTWARVRASLLRRLGRRARSQAGEFSGKKHP